MKIAVRYLAQLKHAAGRAGEELDVEAPCTAGALLATLAERHGQPLRGMLLDAKGGVQPTILLFIGDEQVEATAELRDGDAVTLLTPIAGGCPDRGVPRRDVAWQ
jgi:molybdopterin converting factor small subunit